MCGRGWIWTSKGREKCSVVIVMWDGTRYGHQGIVFVDVRCRVRTMVWDFAHWIRGGVLQNDTPVISGSGEKRWDRISVFVQSQVYVANRSQDSERHVLVVAILHFENDLVPECAEVVLQFR
jgi:hypothetical protein